jgi:hypothetical protein
MLGKSLQIEHANDKRAARRVYQAQSQQDAELGPDYLAYLDEY